MDLMFNPRTNFRLSIRLIKFILLLLVTSICMSPTGCSRSGQSSRQNSSSTEENVQAGSKTGELSEKSASMDTDKDSHKDTEQTKDKETDTSSKDMYTKGTGEATSSKDQSKDNSDDDYRSCTVTKSGKIYISRKVSFDTSWKYGEFSKIHSGKAILYMLVEDGSRQSNSSKSINSSSDSIDNNKGKSSNYNSNTKDSNKKNITVCINAGHGTKGGSSVKTLCHPDGSSKIISGSTSQGQKEGAAITEGMTFPDGTSEAAANLSLARLVRDRLLDKGYNVLMIRDSEDVQLDNIARTLMANHYADCHIALHYDSTDFDKGVFFLSVPDAGGYKNMEPVRSHWKEHQALGSALLSGIKAKGFRLYQDGSMDMDLTQTSYSTIPSIDLEVGDARSDISKGTQEKIADGIILGSESYNNPKK